MTSTAVRRSNRVQGSLIWAAMGAAIAVHLLALGLFIVVGVFEHALEAHAEAAPEPVAAEVELKTTCMGDARLASIARGALCLAPWGADVEACLEQAELMMRVDLSACRGRDEPVAAVAMVSPAVMEKVPPIDPEQLVEELMQQEKEQQQPPPIPPPQPQQQQPPPPPPPPPAPPKKTQVIETVKPNDEKEPDNARFLAEYNTRVEKQTVARGARNEPMVAKSKPEELAPKEKPKDEPSVQKQPEDKLPGQNDRAPDVKGKLSMRAPGAPSQNQEAPQEARTRGAQGGAKGPIVADGFVPRAGDHAIEQQHRDPGEKTKGQNGAGGGAPRVPDLKPTKEVLERALGGGSVDHLEEIENSDETALTAKRWVYASFFNRLKRQVAMNWDPQTVWRKSDPTGAHHGFKTRVTEVRVSLSPKGDLAKIVVTSPSGVTELDDEAVRAFHAAGRFPNPPDGLIKDNLITFAFSFHFEIGAPRTSWRVLRQ
jgi:TonB family protein